MAYNRPRVVNQCKSWKFRHAGVRQHCPRTRSTLEREQLEAIRRVPVGAAALSGVAVLLLLVAWLLIYLLIYLPRGMIG